MGSGAWAYLVGLSARRQLYSRKTLVTAAFLGLIALVVLVAGNLRPWAPRPFGEAVVLGLLGSFFVPLTSLAYGTAVLGDLRDEGTLVYFLARPIPRAALFLLLVLSAAPLALAFNVGGLTLMCLLGSWTGEEGLWAVFGAFAPAFVAGTLAYLALFGLVGAVFRHSTVVAVAYVFFVEVFLGRVPGIVKRISIHFYSTCIALEDASELGIRPPGFDPRLYLPLEAGTALAILACAIAAFLAAGAATFGRSEDRPAG